MLAVALRGEAGRHSRALAASVVADEVCLDEPLAPERGLVGFMPIRGKRPSLRSALLGEIDRLG